MLMGRHERGNAQTRASAKGNLQDMARTLNRIGNQTGTRG